MGSTSHGGDVVCHSGMTWHGSPCGEILDDDWSGTAAGKPWNGLVMTDMLAYSGDSGGTVWTHKDGGVWYSGVMSLLSTELPNNPISLYSHIGNLDDAVWYLIAPVQMS